MPILRLTQMMKAVTAKKPFRFTVKTTVPGETFALPLELTGTYDFDINHGDGSNHHITAWDHTDVTHTYATPGTHEIAITGTIIGWRFVNVGDCALYHETKSWGPFNPGNNGGAFYGCVNHTCTATDIPDLTGVTTFLNIFRNNISLTEIPSINSWGLSLITVAQSMLMGCIVFAQNISGLSFSAVINLLNALRSTDVDCDLSGWGVTNLTNATDFLLDVTLSTANYDALLIGWEAQAVQNNVVFHGGNSKFTAGGGTARAKLVADHNWTIQDGGAESLGPELIADAADRDFSGGQGNWVVVAGDDVTWDNITMNWNCDETNAARLVISLNEGTLYRLEFEITVNISGNIKCSIGGIEEEVVESVSVHTHYIIVGSSNHTQFWANNWIGSIDNVSIKEVL